MESLNKKDIFTQTLLKKRSIATKQVAPITSSTIVDGHGPIIEFDSGSFAYDLRMPSSKGVLPKNHPILLFSESSKAASLEEIKGHPLIKSLNFEFLKIVKVSPTQSTWYDNGQILTKTNKDLQLLVWSSDICLALSSNSTLLDRLRPAPVPTGLLEFLDFYQHIALNNGKGRISAIENIIKEETQWSVNGLYIQAPFKIKKEELFLLGLFVDDKNFKEDSTDLCLPISIYDEQVKEIIKKLGSLENK